MAQRHALRKIELPKCPSGIRGLDEITGGGLPRGRPTLVCGGAGSGKTLLAMEFVVRGARDLGEPGVYMTFEETERELAANVASLGFDVASLIRRKKLAIDHVHIERREIEETGDFDLEGLFVRLGAMIDDVKAKRVVLDTLEALFAGIPNEMILRAELRRLFRWLKARRVTAVITAEQGAGAMTRHGLEEYVSDCVIVLDHRVRNQVATRRLRVVKYRGSRHGTNEYPTLIDADGLSVLPISSLGLNYPVSSERVSSGVPRLDALLGGKGYYRGSTVLVSGTAGTGKSSLAATFADSVCRRGGRCLYASFEESQQQIVRNMASIGIDLEAWIERKRLHLHCVRPTLFGLEMHLVGLHRMVEDLRPEAVIIDPVTNLISVGDDAEIHSMLTRLIDFLKTLGITTVLTSLTSGAIENERTDVNISSLMDTWILLRTIETGSERNRLLYVLKGRGMAHSNQVREFRLTNAGIHVLDVYSGPGATLTGTARMVQEAQDRAAAQAAEAAAEDRRRRLQEEQRELQRQIQTLRARAQSIRQDIRKNASVETNRLQRAGSQQKMLAAARSADRPRRNGGPRR